MSYKEEIEAIKTDIIGEGKFLEYYMHFEKFYKKYKVVILGIIVALVALFAYSKFSEYQNEQRVMEATASFNRLLETPGDKNLEMQLKAKSEKLYDLYLLSNATKAADKKTLEELSKEQGLVGKIASYQLASLSKDLKAIEEAKSGENAVFKELATLQAALLKAKSGDNQGAKEELSKIPATSSLKNLSDAIGHLGITN